MIVRDVGVAALIIFGLLRHDNFGGINLSIGSIAAFGSICAAYLSPKRSR